MGRRAIFLGDLVDRGPHVLDTVRIVRNMVAAGTAFCVAGNHDVKFMRWLRGKQVQIKHGLERSITEVEPLVPEHRGKIASFLDGLVSHYVLDGGKLVVAHAGFARKCTVAAPRLFANSACTVKRRARQTSSGCRFATTGPPNIVERQWSSTAIPQFLRPSGSTTP